MIKKRLESIDFLRTIAIIIMLTANSAPYVLNATHPLWFRLICSLAAPLFIFLSGFSFYISFKKHQNYWLKIKLSIYLLLSAIFVDVFVWRILPFQTFDVLYLIAFGQAINIILFRLKLPVKIFITLICIALSPILGANFGYRFSNTDVNLFSLSSSGNNLSSIFQFSRLFIDGWFPLLPWLAFSIIGSVSAELYDKISNNIKLVKWLSFSLFACGVFALFSQNIIQEEREDYLELFYPPTILFLLIAITFIFTAYAFSIKINSLLNSKLKYLSVLGRHSLFTYILHTFVISYIFKSYFVPSGYLKFTILILAFVSFCFCLTTLLEYINKKKYLQSIPFILKAILGLN